MHGVSGLSYAWRQWIILCVASVDYHMHGVIGLSYAWRQWIIICMATLDYYMHGVSRLSYAWRQCSCSIGLYTKLICVLLFLSQVNLTVKCDSTRQTTTRFH